MEVEQSLLESMPQDQRQKLARRARQEQVRRYHEREKSQPAPKVRPANSSKKGVRFAPKDRLWEATAAGSLDEGRYETQTDLTSQSLWFGGCNSFSIDIRVCF